MKENFDVAIAAQPGHMATAATLAADALNGRVRPWAPGETVAVVGMGSSANAGAVFAEALRAAGVGASSVDASAVAHYPAGFHLADHVIVVSESGRSPEPIAAGKRLGVTPIVVTNDPQSPVAALADWVVPLGGYTDSGVYTIGYTTTLVALAAIAAAGGVPVADAAGLADVAAGALADFTTTLDGVAASLDRASFLDIVGQGTSCGSAQAASLLFRESCAMPTAWYQSIEYLHGPMECCGPGAAVLLFGEGREDAMAAQLRDAGALVVRFASQAGDDAEIHRPSHPSSGYEAAVAEVVFAQCLAAKVAGLRSRNVGDFKFKQPDTKLPEQ